jgi:hypothetical protein
LIEGLAMFKGGVLMVGAKWRHCLRGSHLNIYIEWHVTGKMLLSVCVWLLKKCSSVVHAVFVLVSVSMCGPD